MLFVSTGYVKLRLVFIDTKLACWSDHLNYQVLVLTSVFSGNMLENNISKRFSVICILGLIFALANIHGGNVGNIRRLTCGQLFAFTYIWIQTRFFYTCCQPNASQWLRGPLSKCLNSVNYMSRFKADYSRFWPCSCRSTEKWWKDWLWSMNGLSCWSSWWHCLCGFRDPAANRVDRDDRTSWWRTPRSWNWNR